MSQNLEFTLEGEKLLLLGEKAIYWPDQACLLMADLHLGKAGHFRKNGVPVSSGVMQQDLSRLDQLIARHETRELVMLGDLFHSYHNHEVDQFGAWLMDTGIKCRLIEGNHDILARHRYPDLGIEIQPEGTRMGPFVLRHHPLDTPPTEGYVLAGHIHPGVRLLGLGRQKLTLPCFYFGHWQGLLPAFGSFTGCVAIEPDAEEKVFAVADGQVMAV